MTILGNSAQAENGGRFSSDIRLALTRLRHALNEGARLHLEAERYQGDFECDFTVAKDWITVCLNKYRAHHDQELIPAIHALGLLLAGAKLTMGSELLTTIQWYEAYYGVRTDYALWPSPFVT